MPLFIFLECPPFFSMLSRKERGRLHKSGFFLRPIHRRGNTLDDTLCAYSKGQMTKKEQPLRPAQIYLPPPTLLRPFLFPRRTFRFLGRTESVLLRDNVIEIAGVRWCSQFRRHRDRAHRISGHGRRQRQRRWLHRHDVHLALVLD